MVKPTSSRRAVRNAPQPKVHRYVDAVVSDDFGRLSALTIHTAHGFAKKKLDSATQSLQLRTEAAERKARGTEAREYRTAERGLQAEMRESDHRTRLLSRLVKTKVRPEQKLKHTPPKARKRLWPYASVALPKYDGPVLDRRGERGVFMRVRYYSRRTAEQGVSQRVVRYVFNGAELDEDGNPYQHSNVGLTIDETLCAFDHLEQINWSAAKNAKLLMHGILAVDYRQAPDEMMECGTRWAEEALGRFGLPYLVTLHAPPADGDERNWHLHILWSFRPLERVGDHEWRAGEMLRTDLDNPAAMKLMREMFAAVMTDVSFEAGQGQVYTAKSNADRGLPHEPQVHLTAAQVNRARGGEYVEPNEENHERVMRSKAAVLDDKLRHADEVLAKEQDAARAIAVRWVRVPARALPVPKRVMAATMLMNLPTFDDVPVRSAASSVIPSRVPTFEAEPASIAESVKPFAELPRVPRALGIGEIPAMPPLPYTRSARFQIANLRISSPPLRAKPTITSTVVPPSPVPMAVAPSLSTPPSAILPQPSRLRFERAELPRLRVTAAIPAIPASGSSLVPRATSIPPFADLPSQPSAVFSIHLPPLVQPPPVMANMGFIERARVRGDEAVCRHHELRKREQAEAEQARRDDAEKVAAEQRRRDRIDRILSAIAEERIQLARHLGRRVAEASLLARFELEAEALEDAAVQERLERIAIQHNAEVAQIATYVRQSLGHVQPAGEGWTLADDAPADIRDLVVAWGRSRPMHLALARVVAAEGNRVAKVVAVPTVNLGGTAWHRARQARDRAMIAWDEVERLDDRGVRGGGRKIDRPGILQFFDPVAAPSRSVPRNRWGSGSGLGD